MMRQGGDGQIDIPKYCTLKSWITQELLILITFQSFKAAFSMDIKNQMLLASILG
jgi:hypothetical protein